MIPGSNLLAQALTVIQPQTVRYYRNTGRATNAAGMDVASFAPGVDIPQGSVQAVPLRKYESLGLDFKARYVTWLVCADIVGVERDRSGDQFEWNGRRFNVVGETNWFSQDGWCRLIGQDIGGANA
jgi:hypothetical protein